MTADGRPREPTRILLADDHAVVRRGLRLVLDAEPDLQVVAEADDGVSALEEAFRIECDLAVLDVTMPRMGGLQAARELVQRRPSMRILMLSMHRDEEFFLEALRVGAAGYVVKSAADRDLIGACRAVMRGETFLYSDAQHLLLRYARPDELRDRQLSDRESEVLALIAEGHTTQEIAQILVISPRTVDRHRENLLAKLHLRNRVELARYAIRHRLIEP
jgi:DNA-binding NarL/FixJ family response regulator